MNRSFTHHFLWYPPPASSCAPCFDSLSPYVTVSDRLNLVSAFLSLSLSLSQVKQIMEEAVTRKFVHADSSHIISFCGKCYFFSWLHLHTRPWTGCAGKIREHCSRPFPSFLMFNERTDIMGYTRVAIKNGFLPNVVQHLCLILEI